jgi:drug/metabolite transporter (DMT)-like permease
MAYSLRKRRIVGTVSLCLVAVGAFDYPNHRHHNARSRDSTSFHDAQHIEAMSTSSHLKLSPLDSLHNKNLPSIGQLSEKNTGVLVLFTVPLAWGTFEPAVRLVYQYQPNIPPFVFSLAYYLAASVALSLLAFRFADGRGLQSAGWSSDNLTSDTGRIMPAMGGIELGTYLFVGNALQVIGLKTVPSDRAAFLLQLTTVFVPLVDSLLAWDLGIIPVKTWISALVALSGVGLIGLDGGSRTAVNGSNAISTSFDVADLDFSSGDFYIMVGALFYSFHCIRLELYSRRTLAIRLAAAKATTEAAWSALVLIVCISASELLAPDYKMPLLDLARGSGDDILAYLRSLDQLEGDPHWLDVGVATLWTGLVTVAYTIYAQSFGQSRVPAATANLIYTIQPFFTALIAFLVLGEKLGPYGYVGGSLIGAAVLLVVADDEESASLCDSDLIEDETETS